MVVVINTDDWSYQYASDQTQAPARATANGWAIDQIDGWAYAYYGINNDGTFANIYNNAGSNGVATTLFDDPNGWPANTLFYALDAATCYKSSACQNSILGYYFWSWSIDNTGKPSAFITGPAWKTSTKNSKTLLRDGTTGHLLHHLKIKVGDNRHYHMPSYYQP